MTQAYPLEWPRNRDRTPAHRRERARFSSDRKPVSVAQALKRLREEVGRLNAKSLVISTNVALRQDGLPYSSRRDPDDPAAACYFYLDGSPMVLACDRWTRTADNIVAIAKHIAALRGQERWGVGTTKQAFAGFKALPPPTTNEDAELPWRHVLLYPANVRPDIEGVRARYHALAAKCHPDKGGSAADFRQVVRAFEQAQKELL